jgi:hypothetical protein
MGMALWTRYQDEGTGEDVPGLASARVLRFRRHVRLDRLLIHPVQTRWAPVLPSSPAHVTLGVWDAVARVWQQVGEHDLPPMESMDAPAHSIDLGGLQSDHLRVVCDLEHPVPPTHGELCANPRIVPFKALRNLECQGAMLDDAGDEPPVQDRLHILGCEPRAVDGQEAILRAGHSVVFSSPALTVGFSLVRPMVTHLGWDAEGEGRGARNLVCARVGNWMSAEASPVSGPLLRGLRWDLDPRQWGGAVEVAGNRIIYRDLHVDGSVSIDATFEALADGLRLELRQRVSDPVHALEAATWALFWRAAASATSTWAMPVREPGRTGECALPALFMSPGYGTLNLAAAAGQPRLITESSAEAGVGSATILLGAERLPTGDNLLAAGASEAELELRVGALPPDGPGDMAMPRGLRRYYASGLGFRSEFGGFSNNAYSCNCHLSQSMASDIACTTARPQIGPDPAELARSTIALAFQGGPGYGDNRELYQDSDPALLNSAGLVHKVRPDIDWLRANWPYIRRAVYRVLGSLDGAGLQRCERLSGNSGTKAWSSNGWDVISFGHYDAYSNAQAYRALRCSAAMARDAGDIDAAGNCRDAADGLKAAYLPCFFNAQTGLIAGWRSRDGELHDYIFPWINGLAVCYGLVDGQQAREIIERVEAARVAKGQLTFHLGVAANLEPVPYSDHAMAGLRADGRDLYGVYINGCLTPCLATWYLRALDIVGLDHVADQACRELCEGFDEDRFMGGVGAGNEFYTWEGLATGYEGALVGVPHALLAAARHLGFAAVDEPEWWPA